MLAVHNSYHWSLKLLLQCPFCYFLIHWIISYQTKKKYSFRAATMLLLYILNKNYLKECLFLECVAVRLSGI